MGGIVEGGCGGGGAHPSVHAFLQGVSYWCLPPFTSQAGGRERGVVKTSASLSPRSATFDTVKRTQDTSALLREREA